MQSKEISRTEFNNLADLVESILSEYGTPYWQGNGDFTLNHDYYGNHELGVIFLKPLLTDACLKRLREAVFPQFNAWELWLTFLEGAEWNGNDQIVVRADGWNKSSDNTLHKWDPEP